MIDSLLDWGFTRALPWAIVGLLAVFALLCLAGIIWIGCEVLARRWGTTGVVVGKTNTPDTRQTNVVPVVTGNGGMGVGVVSTGHDREWITLIEVEGAVYEFDSVTAYAKTKVGDRVSVRMKRNAMSGRSVTEVSW